VRLLDRLVNRYRADGYWEGMASGAAVLLPMGVDNNRESTVLQIVSEARQAYTTNGIVFAVNLCRLMLLSEAKFVFRDDTDDSFSNLPPRAGILEVPWPNGTSGELWGRMIQDVDLAGNAYLWKAEPDLLVRLPPGEVTIVSELTRATNGNSYRKVIGYDWNPGANRSEEAQYFTVDEVAHWSPIPDPSANFRGMSWLTPVLREVRADSGLTYYKTQYIDHGQPLIALRYAQKLRPETVDSIMDRIQAKYGGAANAFKPLVLDQGVEPVVGGGLQELNVAAIQAIGEERICAASGVPPEVVGFREVSSEKYMPAMRRFADLTCRPLWRSGCAALAQLVSVPTGSRLWFDTTDIAALQAAETERAQVVQVSAAATLTFVQAGFERESVKKAVTAGDLSLLVPDPNAPTPGVNERQTITVPFPGGPPITGPGSGQSTGTSQESGSHVSTLGGTTGVPAGGGGTLTKPQTPMSKTAMPSSIPTTKVTAPNQSGTSTGNGK
jgi:phage portal protein BeeE